MSLEFETLTKGMIEEYCATVVAIDQESPFMDYTGSERKLKVEKQLKSRFGSAESRFFVLKSNGRIEGYFEIHGMRTAKKKHVAYGVGGILKKHYGTGAGYLLTLKAIRSAKESWKKIEMSVIETNKPSLALSQYLGFEIEGQRKNSVYIEGHYQDEILMGLDLSKVR